MIYAYARVSSKGQNLNVQLDALSKLKCDKIFKEKVSSLNEDRPQFEKLLKTLQEGDSLVVWKLDRLGRSMFELVEIVSSLNKKGVQLISITENINTDTPTGRIMFMFFSMMAEYEMDLKKERIEAGRAIAKQNGKLGGRPKGLSKRLQSKAPDVKKMYLAKEGDTPLHSISEIVKITGITRPSIYKCLQHMNIKANRESILE